MKPNRPLVTALAIASTVIVGAGVVGGVASATTSTPTPNSQAIAHLEKAKQEIAAAESILAAPPTTTTTTSSSATTPPSPPPPPPPPANGDSAGVTQNWGPVNAKFSDEFNIIGPVDPSKWFNSVAGCMPGNAGNGKRCPEDASVVAGSFLRETGEANGSTGWLASQLEQRYGKWEVRMRLSAPAPGQNQYHPVLLLWPTSGKWPQGGEYDYAETDIGSQGVDAFIHHPANTVIQDHYTSPNLDLTQWHNYALSWTPTAITGYIDGVQWFTDNATSAQAPGSMHGTIQLDNNSGTNMSPATMDVDYFHVWSN